MNKRIMNSKGMTIVEVLVSVIIISLIMGVLFTLLLQVQKINSDSSEKSSVMLAQNVITKAIERDMIEIGVKSISSCEFEEFNFNENVIDSYYDRDEDKTKYNYECIRIEYNQSYDISDVGYLMVYKQSSSQDDPAWVMRYGRGYYNECEKDSVPLHSNWKETYSVVQKLDSAVDLKIMPNSNEVSYSAVYESGKKYSEQKMNNGKLFIPIQDENGYNYNIDLSFSFRLYNTNSETISNTNVDFICDNNNADALQCKCTGSLDDCKKTEVPEKYKNESGNYVYKCSESKASLGSVVGMNKNFIELSSVIENSIRASKVESIEFLSFESYSERIKKADDPLYNKTLSSVDVSYSQNGSNLMFFELNKDTKMYKLYITQSGGVKVYGNTLTNMFKNFTNLVSVDFSGFSTAGITTMNSMFYNCPKLTTVKGFSSLDLSSVTDVSSMFYNCDSLTTSPFKGMNLSSILYANSTFNESGITGDFDYKTDFNAQNVVSLKSFLRKTKIINFVLDYENQEMPNLTTMNSMLNYITTLKNSYIRNTVAKKLTDMEYMFELSYNLETSEFSDFIVKNVNSLYGFYKNCNKLYSIKFENFDTSKVVYFCDMFNGCLNIENINLAGFSYENAKKFSRAFKSCPKLQYVTFANEDSDATLDNVEEFDEAFYGCQAFRGFKGKHMTLHGVGTGDGENGVKCMFQNAGSKGMTLDLSNLELYNCKNFTDMFQGAKYKFIDMRGIHSKVTDDTINLTRMFNNSSIQYVYLNDAEFKTAVNMLDMFKDCTLLTFVTTVNTDSDESINKYLGGEGELVKIDGKSPFDNFIVTGGYAAILESTFNNCKYLRGFDDGYLDGILTDDRTTNYKNMFEKAFDADILSTVTISEEDYKRVYQLVVPFHLSNSSILSGQNVFNGGNLAVIKFKNAKNVIGKGSGYYLSQTGTFKGFGTKAYNNKRVSSLDIYLSDMRVCRLYNSNNINECDYNTGYPFMFAYLGISSYPEANNPDNFTRYSVDGEEGYKLNVYLSNDCNIAKKQYAESKDALNKSSNNKTNYVWPDGCSAD